MFNDQLKSIIDTSENIVFLAEQEFLRKAQFQTLDLPLGYIRRKAIFLTLLK